jgi:hypothetical protein
MSDSNVALDLLVRAVLQQHHNNLSDPSTDQDHAGIFSDEELKTIVEALWKDRYSSNRLNFQKAVGALISEKVSKA